MTKSSKTNKFSQRRKLKLQHIRVQNWSTIRRWKIHWTSRSTIVVKTWRKFAHTLSFSFFTHHHYRNKPPFHNLFFCFLPVRRRQMIPPPLLLEPQGIEVREEREWRISHEWMRERGERGERLKRFKEKL